MNTPIQISMKLNVEVNMVYKRIQELNLKPIKKVSSSRYYDINDFQEIRTDSYISIIAAKSKMMIVEYWNIYKSYKYDQEIADELGIKLDKLKRILLELKNNDNCITVKSKLC
jgi:hypothetical protein